MAKDTFFLGIVPSTLLIYDERLAARFFSRRWYREMYPSIKFSNDLLIRYIRSHNLSDNFIGGAKRRANKVNRQTLTVVRSRFATQFLIDRRAAIAA
jgi:hypothetical protein